MLMPKRVKYRRMHRGNMRGAASRGNTIAFGQFALQALEPCWMDSRQIEAARIAMTRYMRRGGKVRLIRDNVVIHEGELSTLKRFKDEVKEVQTGQECGMAFANYQDMQKGDVIECFEIETIQRAL